MPQAWLDRVPRDEAGNVVVGFDYPDYVPFLMNARDDAARKRYYVANTNRSLHHDPARFSCKLCGP